MGINGKIKKYADSKMDKLKDDEFYNSVSEEHFKTEKKKFKLSKRLVLITSSLAMVLVMVCVLSWAIQSAIGYNSAQFDAFDATIEEVNEKCVYASFADTESASVKSLYDKSTEQDAYYKIEYPLNDGKDKIVFFVVTNKEYDYSFGAYDKEYDYNGITLKYTEANDFYKSENTWVHTFNACLSTDSERIEITCTCASTDEKYNFFELLNEIMTVK